MANTCITDITFFGERSDLLKLAEYISSIFNDDINKNRGLSRVLEGVGKYNEYSDCRGCISYSDVDEFISDAESVYFYVSQEDAWGPKVELWNDVISALNLTGKITYIYVASEPGMNLYVTNDSKYLYMYKYRIYVYAPDPNKPGEYLEFDTDFTTRREASSVVRDFNSDFKTNAIDLADLKAYIIEKSGDHDDANATYEFEEYEYSPEYHIPNYDIIEKTTGMVSYTEEYRKGTTI